MTKYLTERQAWGKVGGEMRKRLWEATPAWLKSHGLEAKDADRLFEALAALADYEWVVKGVLKEQRFGEESHSEVCAALRFLVDGPG